MRATKPGVPPSFFRAGLSVLGLGVCGVWLALARDDTAAKPELPPLPKVARPPAAQPQVGLAADAHLNKTPPRETKGLDLVKLGWTYNCMECHKLLKQPRWHYDRPMVEHQDVKLQHGNNRFCLNCHHPTNRNAFVDYDGSEIQEADVVLLCAKCHGTTYRDWQAGVHGRQNGYWNKEMGESTKLRCIQCHDPHHPAFQPMKPLPPPLYPPRAAGGSARSSGESGTHP
jgi:hypothetical protein